MESRPAEWQADSRIAVAARLEAFSRSSFGVLKSSSADDGPRLPSKLRRVPFRNDARWQEVDPHDIDPVPAWYESVESTESHHQKPL